MHALSKIDSKADQQQTKVTTTKRSQTYSQVFGNWLCSLADVDDKVVGITPAMGEGSGMQEFAQKFPEKFHDVAIAEQHAVTFAAGMACNGVKPIVAIYSTFLQRAYDQLIHDVALQNLNVLFAIDRAGLVGEDGPTHAGSFDLTYLRCIPNMIVMAPSDENETHKLLSTGYAHQGPAAVRYPRGKGPGVSVDKNLETLEIGKAAIRREGHSVAILAFGSMVSVALESGNSINASVIDMRFVKPIDEDLIGDMAATHQLIVTIEENSIMGGAGSAINQYLLRSNYQIPILNLGLPDKFLEHGKVPEILTDIALDSTSVTEAIKQKLMDCKIQSEAV